MKLHKNQEVVNELKHILKDYPYLEYGTYEASFSQQLGEVLYVRVTDGTADRHLNAIKDICEKLSQATKILFYFSDLQYPGQFYNGADQKVFPNSETEWISFCLKKR